MCCIRPKTDKLGTQRALLLDVVQLPSMIKRRASRRESINVEMLADAYNNPQVV